MKKLANLALTGAFVLGLTGCGKPTPEQIERIEKERAIRTLVVETPSGARTAFLEGRLSWPRQVCSYRVNNYPLQGENAHFFDAGFKNGSYLGDGILDWVEIRDNAELHMRAIGRHDKDFAKYNEFFEKMIKPREDEIQS